MAVWFIMMNHPSGAAKGHKQSHGVNKPRKVRERKGERGGVEF